MATKLAIFGATGATGVELVRQALERGAEVAALVRKPMSTSDSRLTQIRGDLSDVDAIERVIAGSAAVISVLGPRPSLLGKKTTDLYSRAASAFAAAMPKTGVAKLIFCTSAGVEKNDPTEVWWYKHLVKPLLLEPSYIDMRVAEDRLRASSLDWVIVRPSRLTNGGATNALRVSERLRPPGGTTVSRVALAQFMLDQVASADWVHRTPTLAV